jgi:hypothetical protein
MPWLLTLTSFKFKVQKQSKTISTNRITANDSLHCFSSIGSQEEGSGNIFTYGPNKTKVDAVHGSVSM